MATVFRAWAYCRFIEIQSNFRWKKLHRTNQSSNFLGGSFSNRDNVRSSIQFRREDQPQHLKRWFLNSQEHLPKPLVLPFPLVWQIWGKFNCKMTPAFYTPSQNLRLDVKRWETAKGLYVCMCRRKWGGIVPMPVM